MQIRRFARRSLPALLAGSVLVLTSAARAVDSADEAAIRRTVQYYFDGGPDLAKAFHPEGQMLFVRDGKYVAVPIQEYIARASGPRDPAVPQPQKRIVSIDVSGTAATAKLESVRPDMVVTDYMSLLKVDGRWVIVNKIFDRQLREGAAAK